ncbi:Ribonuclease Z [Carabus blaptoides fortunei]
MPKEPKHIVEAQRQRLKIKEKFQKYVPGKVTLQVLGTGAEGAPKSLYMFTDQSRYLFNCGEGTQRLAHEHKMKLSKLEHIFITQPVWDNIGGLPGVSLTIQDVGVPQITLHGPDGLDELFIATRKFVVLKDLDIRMAKCNPNEKFEDNVMSVRYVPLHKSEFIANNATGSNSSSTNESSDDDTDYYAHETSGTRSAIPSTAQLIPHKVREQNTTMCFICRLNPRPGALSVEKCVEAGVPPGPLLGQLKAGKTITLDSGVVVKSEDVCLPDDPGPIIIVVDCPSIHYLDSLQNTEEFLKHQSSAVCDEDLAYFIVHFTPADVMEHPRYREWIDKFSPSTQHLVLNNRNRCMGSTAVHRIQYKLNMLHTDMFPLLGDDGTQIVEENKCETTEMIGNLSVNSNHQELDGVIQGNTLCNVHLRPKKGFDRSGELQIIPSQYIDETLSVEGFSDALKQLKVELASKKNLTIGEYPRILFLGTGSCIPNKTRNTSGILIETSENSAFLMDCGEGTYGQLVRFYGYERAKTVLANLKAVYISHLHADHHIGLVGLLKGRRRAIISLGLEIKPLILFAPRQILSWLHIYHRRFEKISNDYELFANGDMVMGDSKLSDDKKLMLQNNLHMSDVSTVLVRHCPNAFGVAFTHNDGWKLTYSGDTMPCDRLVHLGINSDILIHEATMEDELAHEAVTKMHSTTSQAITIGQRMKAKHILLTHFSQRYAKLPRFNDNFAANVGIAFDNMQVRLDELPLVPLLYPALRLMFAEHYEELEHKAIKRQLKDGRKDTAITR